MYRWLWRFCALTALLFVHGASADCRWFFEDPGSIKQVRMIQSHGAEMSRTQIYEGDEYAVRIDIQKPSDRGTGADLQWWIEWDGQLRKGTKYVVSFCAKSSAQKLTLVARTMNADSPWNLVGKESRLDVSLTPEWKQYTYRFIVDQDYEHVRPLSFWLGTLNPEDSIFLKQVEIRETDHEAGVDTKVTIPQASSAVTKWFFDEDDSIKSVRVMNSHGAEVNRNPAHSGAVPHLNIYIENPSPRNVDADIQWWMDWKGALEKGGTYKVSFEAKSTEAVGVTARTMNADSPWNLVSNRARQTAGLTSEWKQFEYQFRADSDYEHIRPIAFFLGTLPKSTVISIRKLFFEQVGPGSGSSAPVKISQDRGVRPVLPSLSAPGVPSVKPPVSPAIIVSTNGYCVAPWKGRPTVFHNGEPISVTAYYNSSWDDKAMVLDEAQKMTAAGVNVHHLQAALYWEEKYPSGDVQYYGPPMEGLDRRIRAILAMNPNAQFLLNVHTFVPGEWYETHPEELITFEDGHIPKLRRPSRAPNSFASEKWKMEVGERIRHLISFLKTQDYYDRIIGLHTFVGNEGQWTWWRPDQNQYTAKDYAYYIRQVVDHSPAMTGYFRRWLIGKYDGDVQKLRDAWGDLSITFETAAVPTEKMLDSEGEFIFRDPSDGTACHIADYFEAYSQARLEIVNWFGKVIKEETADNPKLSGAYYGAILFHHIGGNKNVFRHLFNYENLVDTPYIDYFVSPPFHGCIEPGGAAFHHIVTDSLLNAGKYLILEHDIATHLKRRDLHEFDKKSPQDIHDSLAIYKRSMAYLLSRRMGVWWWDFELDYFDHETKRKVTSPVPVWWNHPDFWSMFKSYSQIAEKSLQVDCSSVSEIAVIYSEKTAYYMQNEARGITRDIVMEQLPEFLKVGAPIDMYTTTDFFRAQDYKLYIVWNAFYLSPEERSMLEAKCRRGGSTVLWLYASGVMAEDSCSEKNISELTSIQTELAGESENIRIQITNPDHPLTEKWVGTVIGSEHDENNRDDGYANIIPLYAANDPAATVLGRYVVNNRPGLVVKEYENWKSVFCGTYPLSAAFVRSVAEWAGVHIYADRDSALYANASYLGLELPADSRQKIVLPHKAKRVVELFSGAVVAKDTNEFMAVTETPDTLLYQLYYQ